MQSTTSPIAVLGMLKSANVPKSLEIQIAGESLFTCAGDEPLAQACARHCHNYDLGADCAAVFLWHWPCRCPSAQGASWCWQ